MYKRMFEMSNIFPEESGVPHVIWVATKSGRERHGARVKVEVDGTRYTLMILADGTLKWVGDVPIKGKALKKLIAFVTLNREAILDHWNGKTSSGQFTKAIQAVK